MVTQNVAGQARHNCRVTRKILHALTAALKTDAAVFVELTQRRLTWSG